MTTVSVNLSNKAAKIIGEGRIEWVKGHVYRVQGDSGMYTVHVSYPQEISGSCDCPSKGVCSHLIAACAWELTHPVHSSTEISDAFEGII